MDKKEEKHKKILLTGGGTGGSVTPLLAIYESLKEKDEHEFLFVGTKEGIEKEMVNKTNIKYKWIHAGKFRRYFSVQNLIDAIKIIVGFFESLVLLMDEKPNVVISAGSFVSVPLVWGAWLFNIPVLIHQMDVRPGLANKLMAPCARKITTVFEESVSDYGNKAEWVGNPFQLKAKNGELKDIYQKFNLKDRLPVVLVIGGGTGAVGLNNLVYESLDELIKFCQVIHMTGRGKNNNKEKENYFSFDFLEQNKVYEIMKASDLIITRAGLSTLFEIAYFKKPAIIIPMPDSHQEDNAKYFSKKEAGLVLNEKKINKEEFVKKIKDVLKNLSLQKKLSENIGKIVKRGANERIVEIIKKLAYS